MLKKTLSILLILLSVLGFSLTASSAETNLASTGTDSKLYFEVPSDWQNFKYVYCHVWELDTGTSLAPFTSKKEKCTLEDDGRYSFDFSKVGGLKSGTYYGVLFVNDNLVQTYDAVLTTACLGDTLYCNNTVYENPTDSNRTCRAAFYKNQDPAKFGPVMQITSIGNLIGTCLPPGATAESMFSKFLTEKLDNARQYSGKDDQTLVDDMAQGLGLSKDQIDSLIKASNLEVNWDKNKSNAPSEEKPIIPSVGGTPATGRNLSSVVIGIVLVAISLFTIVIIRRKREIKS